MVTYLVRVTRYLRERFESEALVLSIGLSLLLYARVRPVPTTALLVIGGVTYGWYLLLRLADEWKDAAYDRVHHPERPLPRGLVSGRDLVGLGVGTLVVIFLGAVWVGLLLEVAGLTLGLLGWQGLAGREFFRRGLRERFWLYNGLSYVGNFWIVAGVSFLVSRAAGAPFSTYAALTGQLLLASLILELTRKADRTKTDDGYRYHLSDRAYLGTLASIYTALYAWLAVSSPTLWLVLPYALSLTALTSLTRPRRFTLLQFGMYLVFLISLYLVL